MSTHTDRELLELAAKAAGLAGSYIDGYDSVEEEYFSDGIYCTDENDCPYTWNPLKFDGDALRLAVELGIDIEQGGGSYPEGVFCLAVCMFNFLAIVIKEPFGDDKLLATRRAIVRAAAEIGRGQL